MQLAAGNSRLFGQESAWHISKQTPKGREVPKAKQEVRMIDSEILTLPPRLARRVGFNGRHLGDGYQWYELR